MKLNKNTKLLITAAVLISAAIKIGVNSGHWRHKLAEANHNLASVQAQKEEMLLIKKTVFAAIPVGNNHLGNLNAALTQGGVALYRLAVAHHLSVGILTINSTNQGDIVMQEVEKPLPMTNDTIKHMALLLKANFNSLNALTDFVEQIPVTGGYLNDIKIKGDEAALTIDFIGS